MTGRYKVITECCLQTATAEPAQCQRERESRLRHRSELTRVVNLLPICLVNNEGDELSVLCKIILNKQTGNSHETNRSLTASHRNITAVQEWIKHKFIMPWLCRSVPALPCQWCVWWAAPTQQRPLLDTGPPACTGDCWPDCRRPSPGPASHPSYCTRHTTQNTNTSQSVYSDKNSVFLIYCQILRYREFHLHPHFHLDVHKTWWINTSSKHTHTHTPVYAGGIFEQGGVPAQVDDIIVLTKVLPCDPENTCKAHKDTRFHL